MGASVLFNFIGASSCYPLGLNGGCKILERTYGVGFDKLQFSSPYTVVRLL
jgi:hypothetical protein